MKLLVAVNVAFKFAAAPVTVNVKCDTTEALAAAIAAVLSTDE
jgi:hypothetical protein